MGRHPGEGRRGARMLAVVPSGGTMRAVLVTALVCVASGQYGNNNPVIIHNRLSGGPSTCPWEAVLLPPTHVTQTPAALEPGVLRTPRVTPSVSVSMDSCPSLTPSLGVVRNVSQTQTVAEDSSVRTKDVWRSQIPANPIPVVLEPCVQ